MVAQLTISANKNSLENGSAALTTKSAENVKMLDSARSVWIRQTAQRAYAISIIDMDLALIHAFNAQITINVRAVMMGKLYANIMQDIIIKLAIAQAHVLAFRAISFVTINRPR